MLRALLAASIIALAPFSGALARTPYPETVFHPRTMQFAPGSYCGSYVGQPVEAFYRIKVKKGQSIALISSQPFLTIRNPKGKFMDMNEFRLYDDEVDDFSFQFTALHDGYYTIIPSDGHEFYTESMVLCAV